MTTKFIEDIRKIAKTDELLKRIPNNKPDSDKASIGKRRGVGLAGDNVFNPCQLLYSSTDGSYTFAGLIAGTEGPRIQDGDYNHCTQLNTITGMREAGVSPDLKMILKPDGVFLPPDEKWYFSRNVLNYASYFNEWDDLPFFNGDNKWWYSTKEAALEADVLALIAFFNDAYSLEIVVDDGELELTPITQDYIDNNYPSGVKEDFINLDTVLYTSLLTWTGDAEGESYTSILEVPINYDYFSNTFSPAEEQIVVPLRTLPGGDVNQTNIFSGMPEFYATLATFQLRIRVETDRLWVPNPEEEAIYPLKYKNGVSIVTFEFGPPTYSRTGMVRPGKDGGFVLFETDSGIPINNAYVYRQDRTLTTVVPVSQMAAYLA